MKRSLFFLLFTVFAMRAQAAAPILDATNLAPADTGINGAALTSSPVWFSRVGAYSTLSLYAVLTRGAATALNFACVAGPSQAVMGPVAVSSAVANGTITIAPGTFVYPVSSSGTYRILVGPLNDAFVQCTLSGTGATSDTVALYARFGGLP